ncbi:uncharacterized protein PHACADRAFT_202831 [Phanerochaete carnosa HHB-10118-sp]|uniref:G-protein coupled receptors family 1 profile domain-containing protein n=1 Tax=Phanerochaete carnosa (strain HHB-10118-sp) TaxID=650164 RepID=K5VNZ0_PHACS|nr:uncharacterized protein PHACADRAFT_202831 [Phanerochaete carnosa HHB-10118-sp]EKM48425.1 hypothetical protein PHACADRAFT_202831 [Phanerochaete carnosa HHB-10118-sp]
MSAQSDQALVQAYSRLVTSNYIGVAAACKYILYLPFHCSHNICPSGLVAYEFGITFGKEIEIVWKRPITARAVLLGSVRWYMLLMAVLNIAPATANALGWALILIQFLQVALFSALRVFAVWDKSYVWSLITFALSMVPFATNIYNAVMMEYEFDLDLTIGAACIEQPKISAQVNGICMFHVMYTTRSSLILADAIVLVLTWIKTFRHWRNARRLKMKASLTTCLLRDGTTYFIALLALNISQLLTYNIFDPDSRTILSGLITNLPPILINRFIINLRTAGSTASDYSMHMSDQRQRQSSLQFTRPTGRLGNMGATLQDGWGDEPFDDENDVAEVREEGRHEASAEA